MATPTDDDPDDKPLDPAIARVQARLRGLMAIAAGTLGLGVLAIFVIVLFKATRSTPDDAVPAPPWQSIVEITTAGTVVGTSVSGGQVAITVDGKDGRIVEVHDLRTGRLIGKAALIAR